MGLPNLYEPPPQDHAGWWDEFWFQNWIDHQDIQQAILADTAAGNPNDPIYVIIPWVASDATGCLLRHQFFHNDMNNITGYGGQDLTNLNFKDPQSVQDWVYNHYQEHLAAHTFLDI
jgi:hypothetical protein